MPGVDFNRLRAEITMEQVLDLLSFQPTQCTGDQWYGCCPVEGCTSGGGRCFSVHLAARVYCCHKCHSQGNQLDLWAAATQLSLHRAMIELCGALGREVPWIYRW